MTASPEPASHQPATGGSVVAGPVELRWWPTPAAASTATVAVVALLLAVATRRAELLVLAAGPLALLAAAPRGAVSPVARVVLQSTPSRISEGEQLLLEVSVSVESPLEHLSLRFSPALALLEPLEQPEQVAVDCEQVRVQWRLRPARWGRWDLGSVTLIANAPGRLQHAVVAIDAGLCAVFPRMNPVRTLLRPAMLPRLIGDHASTEAGAGVEFAGTRPYVDGDPARLVHWRSSARRGRLFITQRHAERLADLVFVVDAFSDVGEPPNSSLDVAVRVTTSLAAGYLRAGDRVGAMLLTGGSPRSIPLGLGRAQLTRVVELLLEARRSVNVADPDLDLLPRRLLPPGALVLVATPLLDQRVLDAVARLRERGTSLIVLDVLDADAVSAIWAGPVGELAVRVWRLDREAMLGRLRERGIVVVPAFDHAQLATRLTSLRSRVLARSRR